MFRQGKLLDVHILALGLLCLNPIPPPSPSLGGPKSPPLKFSSLGTLAYEKL